MMNAADRPVGLLAAAPAGDARAATQAMPAHRFDVMGWMRMFWDFFYGFCSIVMVTRLQGAVSIRSNGFTCYLWR